MRFFIGFLLLALVFVGCTYSKKEVDYPLVNTCDTSNVKFSVNLLPLFAAKCSSTDCHNSTDIAGGWVLENWVGVKDLVDNGNGRLIKAIEHDPSASAMPKGGAKLSDCEISKIKAWINAGALEN